MITCGESLGHLGKNEAKILVVSDSVLSVDKKGNLLRYNKTLLKQHFMTYCFASLKVNRSQKF